MTGKPMLLKDLEVMRPNLVIAPFERVQVVIGASERKLSIDLECIACEELLDWDFSKGWWACSGCGQETTDKEGADLLRACYEGLREVIGDTNTDTDTDTDTDRPDETKDEGKGIGRWVRALMGN